MTTLSMVPLTTSQLRSANRRGLIPGPDEPDELFTKRFLEACSSPPSLLLPTFDLEIDWLPVAYSNKGLLPWHGGALFFEEDGRVRVQLRKTLQTKKQLYFLYSKKELLEHEALHAVRREFNEPLFEEMLAYQTATSAFRRACGPLVQTTAGASLFLLAAFVSWWSAWPFILISGIGLFKLAWRRRQFLACRAKLTRLVGLKAQALMIRLTDAEILHFSKVPIEEIERSLLESSSLRHKMIQASYFQDS